MLPKTMTTPTFLEFFAGGGMARAGFGARWKCLFANDIDARKGASYVANWGADDFRLADIHRLTAADIPCHADVAWASFPCQDLSLAGAGRGLDGARSGAFWGLRDLLADLAKRGRAPKIVVLENVVGALTSNGGGDFTTLCRALADLGYDFGAMVVDAARFVPQSRPRLFVVAVSRGLRFSAALSRDTPAPDWTTPSLARAHAALRDTVRDRWIWWSLPIPPTRNTTFADLIENDPGDIPWHDTKETQRLLSLMAPIHRAAVEKMQQSGERQVGAIYRRTRVEAGQKVQRAEARFDGFAGCLRTPGGGSSRQFIILIKGRKIRTRLLSGREAARLMGLPEDYRLPARYSETYHLLGDGVAVPAVRWLAQHLLEPLVAAGQAECLLASA
jgi:DNA (cytosine-5)-methyltransferase 1